MAEQSAMFSPRILAERTLALTLAPPAVGALGDSRNLLQLMLVLVVALVDEGLGDPGHQSLIHGCLVPVGAKVCRFLPLAVEQEVEGRSGTSPQDC